MSAPSGMKTCPFCAEDVREEVVVCPYCGSALGRPQGIASTSVAGGGPPLARVAPTNVPEKPKGVGAAVAGLVLGIVGLIGSFVPCLGVYALPLTVLAIIFGIAGRHHAMGIAGFVCGLIGTAIGAYWLYIIVLATDAAERVHQSYEQHIREPRRLYGPACHGNGYSGVCVDVSDCPGTTLAGFCEGESNIQCCIQ